MDAVAQKMTDLGSLLRGNQNLTALSDHHALHDISVFQNDGAPWSGETVVQDRATGASTDATRRRSPSRAVNLISTPSVPTACSMAWRCRFLTSAEPASCFCRR